VNHCRLCLKSLWIALFKFLIHSRNKFWPVFFHSFFVCFVGYVAASLSYMFLSFFDRLQLSQIFLFSGTNAPENTSQTSQITHSQFEIHLANTTVQPFHLPTQNHQCFVLLLDGLLARCEAAWWSAYVFLSWRGVRVSLLVQLGCGCVGGSVCGFNIFVHWWFFSWGTVSA
jgi:hypothetical protein